MAKTSYINTMMWLWLTLIAANQVLSEVVVPVPHIPESMTDTDMSFWYLWGMALKDDDSLERSHIKPSTVLTPHDDVMFHLVPLDASHPLYDDSEDNVKLRKEFILDYLVLQPVDEQDSRMMEPEGLTVRNFNDKALTFKRLDNETISVNDAFVEEVMALDDGTVIFILDDFLFDHEHKVGEAFELLNFENDYYYDHTWEVHPDETEFEEDPTKGV